jgi:tetratricopeptide (TPR) repeat protein
MNEKTAELEKNELAEWADKHFGSLRTHGNTILLAILAALLLTMLGAYWMASRNASKSEPWRQLQVASASYGGPVGDRQTSHYELVAEQFPDSLAGLWALQMAGDEDLRMGLSKMVSAREEGLKQIERARKSLQKIQESTLQKPELLVERSLFSLGYALESAGKFDDAKAAYQRLLEALPDSTMAKQAQLALARIADPSLTAAFEKFKAVGTAPGMTLPPIPDISFPDDATPSAG